MATNHLLATPAFALPIGSSSDDEDDGGEDAGVYSFGQNTYGELALGDTNDRSNPTRVDLGRNSGGKRVVDVACGNEQTAILFGITCILKLLGAISGARHSHLSVENGDVFTCGYNDSGQCAIGTTERVPTLRFSPGLSSNRTARVFSGNGSEHLAALSANGNLYTVGFNMRGQLGLGTATTVTEATLVEELVGKRVVDVACSYFHTAIVIDNGDLYACGCNDYGQLGLGDHSAPPLDRAVVPQLSCGYHHTAIVTEDGAVYTFGRNDYGQLGLGHKLHTARPTHVESLSRMRITQVACGCYHTLALSGDGKVFPFGRNNHGQLGLETTVDCLSPQLISTLRNKSVIKVAAGFYHSVCLVGMLKDENQSTNGSGTLSGDLRKMLNNSTRSDITFVIEGRPLFAHSCILVARCEPLEKMLDGRMKDGSQPEIAIPEYSYDVFAAFMEFLYTDQVVALATPDLAADFALELHALADQYLVTSLRRLFHTLVEAKFVQTNSAHFRNAFTLKKRCLGFIMDHFAHVIASKVL
ncbi:RCC1 and BTB domain-containing protein 2 [Phytophthora nicotianae]|uniref:RCC1 and BTB domain-containing protein 2 n=1 Tax=Phytophthora nicotianae TaxID=4792 RepID=A0A0W8C8L5_PHYNI|nr:RCC1 and BTB domain-containing protein 2 [Phytophthora nicotianae]